MEWAAVLAVLKLLPAILAGLAALLNAVNALLRHDKSPRVSKAVKVIPLTLGKPGWLLDKVSKNGKKEIA